MVRPALMWACWGAVMLEIDLPLTLSWLILGLEASILACCMVSLVSSNDPFSAMSALLRGNLSLVSLS